MDDDANQMRHDIQEDLSVVIVEQIVKGEVGAVATPDVNADGCHLMKFTSKPFHCKERQNLVVKGKHLNLVGGAPFWCTDSEVEATHLVHHVVLGFLLMEEILDENPLPRGCKTKEATRLKAKKIGRHDHDHIIEEIIRREALEPPDCEGMKEEHGKQLAQRLLKADGAAIDS